MAKFEIKDIQAEAVPGEKQITVETVNVATNMDRKQFFEFIDKIHEAVSNAEDHQYQKMKKAENEIDNAEDEDAKSDWTWRESLYREKWHQFSDLERLFNNWLEEHKGWEGEEE